MKRSLHAALFIAPLVASCLTPCSAQEAPAAEEAWQLHAQTTWVWQHKPAFQADYSGARSLSPDSEKDYSFSATVFAGARLMPGTELYFNPELVRGVPMSGLAGLGGLSNGELQKTAGARFKLYRARLFVRQTWGLGDETEAVESGFNQLAGTRATERLVLTAGNLAVSDLFDASSYAHDARSQFMNWALISHGAYDFAADARGYSVGAALEYFNGPWAVRAGRFALPKVPNGVELDTRLGAHHGDQIELERAYKLGAQDGKVRVLWFRNTMASGRFDDALDLASATGELADTALVRHRQHKQGWGLSWEQSVQEGLGVFARAARSDGLSEVVAFAEIDQSLSTGVVVNGRHWARANDNIGLAWARNGLSASHRAYLASGAMGFFVGDGALNYKPENIIEGYYSLGLPDAAHLHNSAMSLGVQYISNPAYNQDRGPVKVFSVRLHTEI